MSQADQPRFGRALEAGTLAVALLPGLLLAVWYDVEAFRAAGALGFPLDDSWIHAQFARNLATGHGFTYTGGRWVSGSTAPAWTILLAAGFVVLRNIIAAAVTMGTICLVAAGYYSVRLTQLLGVPRGPSVIAGTLVAVLPIMTWGVVSGMEVPLAAALVLAGLYHHFRPDAPSRRRHLGLALLGASALARPESLAIVGVVVVLDLFRREPLRARLARCAGGAAVAALAFAPLVAFSYLTIHRPLPTTFYAKSGPGIVRAIETHDGAMAGRTLLTFGPRAAGNFWLILRDQLSWGVWLAVIGAIAAVAGAPGRRLGVAVALILLVVPFAMGVTAPQRLKPDNVRYAAQLVVLACPLIVAGAWRVLRRATPAVIVVGLAASLVGWGTFEQSREFALSVKNIQELHVTMGRWMADHLPQDAVVAVNDVGAIAYFSGRRILDLEGLVTPEVLPYRGLPDRGLREVTDLRPDFVAIFPGWYPEIARSPDFREIHRVSIPDNMIAAGDTLVVYQSPWTKARQ